AAASGRFVHRALPLVIGGFGEPWRPILSPGSRERQRTVFDGKRRVAVSCGLLRPVGLSDGSVTPRACTNQTENDPHEDRSVQEEPPAPRRGAGGSGESRRTHLCAG